MQKRILAKRLLSLTAVFLIAVVSGLGQSTGGIKGKVRTASGSGIGAATVTARQDGSDVKTVKADSKGNFLLDGLSGGKYNIVFDASGFSAGVLYNVEVKTKKVSDLGDRLILTRDPGDQIILKGSVFFKEGFAVTGAKIEVEKLNADGSTNRLGSSYTNVSGEFTFRPQGPSKLRVTATYKGVSGTKEIEVDDPAIYRLAISLNLSSAEK